MADRKKATPEAKKLNDSVKTNARRSGKAYGKKSEKNRLANEARHRANVVRGGTVRELRRRQERSMQTKQVDALEKLIGE